uniref:RanBP2-type domain-containing protein n=1 Tax=Clastoptera arizonana TaxID=38151 RepID=A0A1B6C6W1_9HEMI
MSKMERNGRKNGTVSGGSYDSHHWDCSVCTFRNSQGTYKCKMCHARKGTSRGKSTVIPQLEVQQYNAKLLEVKQKLKKKKIKRNKPEQRKNSSTYPKLENVDRSSVRSLEITVNNVTVVFAEFKPKNSIESNSSNQVSEATMISRSDFDGNSTSSVLSSAESIDNQSLLLGKFRGISHNKK